MTISPSLAKQFDSPKNQIPNITDNGTKTYHNHSFTDMLSIYLPITTDKSQQINGKATDSNQPLNKVGVIHNRQSHVVYLWHLPK